MALTHLLDTSVYSQPIRDVPMESVMRRWSALNEESICISAVVHAELMQGLMARDSKKFWARYKALLAKQYTILPFDSAVAETYSRLVVELQKAGKPKPIADLMITATARHHHLTIATLNIKDFSGIPGVKVEYWGR
jgi:predicted nucleic acid-binding protein